MAVPQSRATDMPLLFHCQLICDADDCENTQDAVATLAQGTVYDLLGLSNTNPTAPFQVSYDRSSGFDWKMYDGKSVCSPACHAHVEGGAVSSSPTADVIPIRTLPDASE